jgi:SAM-dependent methyltransferase
MDLDHIERAAWHAAGQPPPSQIARAVMRLRESYLGARAAGADATLAKLAFFGVADAPKWGVVLAELDAARALPSGRSWRMLDLGAGPGTTTLAVAEWLRVRALGPDRIHVTAIDRDTAALEKARVLLSRWREEAQGGAQVMWDALAFDLERASLPRGPYDLVLCANAANEIFGDDTDPIARRTDLFARAIDVLSPEGTLIVIEPALKETARSLHRIRDALLERGVANVFAPCLRGAPCPMLATPRDWCHEERRVALPERTRLVARLAHVRRETLKFTYVSLRKDGRSLHDAFPRANLRIVSRTLVSKGRDEVFVCGAGGRTRVLRNRRDRTETNAGFDALDRGLLATIDGVGGERASVAPSTAVSVYDPTRAPAPDASLLVPKRHE